MRRGMIREGTLISRYSEIHDDLPKASRSTRLFVKNNLCNTCRQIPFKKQSKLQSRVAESCLMWKATVSTVENLRIIITSGIGNHILRNSCQNRRIDAQECQNHNKNAWHLNPRINKSFYETTVFVLRGARIIVKTLVSTPTHHQAGVKTMVSALRNARVIVEAMASAPTY